MMMIWIWISCGAIAHVIPPFSSLPFPFLSTNLHPFLFLFLLHLQLPSFSFLFFSSLHFSSRRKTTLIRLDALLSGNFTSRYDSTRKAMLRVTLWSPSDILKRSPNRKIASHSRYSIFHIFFQICTYINKHLKSTIRFKENRDSHAIT